MVKKNTLPYVHQWAVIDTETGYKIGEYRTKYSAELARKRYEQYGLPNSQNDTTPKIEDAIRAACKRMKQPEGDPLPRPPKHSNKRRVELD